MQQQKFLFVINPRSGNSDKSELEDQIKNACAQYKKEFKLFHTSGTNDKDKLSQEIQNFKPDVVVACGGDGTVNIVASQILSRNLALGIIPMGSANGLANELEISDEINTSLHSLFRGNVKNIDVIKVNDNICLHLSDVGFNAQMIKDFEESGERGMLAYAKSFFNSLRDKKTTEFTLKLNDGTKTFKAEMIVIANATSYGSGAVINPRGKLDDGSFEVIVFKPIPYGDLLSLTLESFLGDIQNSPHVEIFKTKHVTIECHEPELLQVDGELIGNTQMIKANVDPATLKIVC